MGQWELVYGNKWFHYWIRKWSFSKKPENLTGKTNMEFRELFKLVSDKALFGCS